MIQILVVDDNRRDAQLARECLTHDYSADVTVAADAEHALRLLAEDGYTPDLVLLGVIGQSLLGFQLLRRIRRQKPRLPIVVLSASSSPDEVSRAYAEGANMYVEKSLDRNELRRALCSIAQLWIEPLGRTRAACAG